MKKFLYKKFYPLWKSRYATGLKAKRLSYNNYKKWTWPVRRFFCSGLFACIGVQVNIEQGVRSGAGEIRRSVTVLVWEGGEVDQ